MKCRWIVFSFLVTLTVPLFAEVELTGSPRELSGYLTDIPQTVSITGKAEKKVPADQAIIHVEVTTESRSMDEALSQNKALRQQITTKLLAAGLPKDRIKASQFSSTPESGIFTDKIRSYKVENTMKITTTSEAEFQAVAALIDEYKEVEYKTTEFELSNRKEIERQLLAEACRDAVAKKDLYALELKVTLTPVRFHDGHVALYQPQGNLRMQARKVASFALDEEASFTPPPVQFDEMTLTANITVEYNLSAQ
jgi:uncharacterized protein YggE